MVAKISLPAFHWLLFKQANIAAVLDGALITSHTVPHQTEPPQETLLFDPMTMESMTVDVLVCGGGMSGMACAAAAADSGAKVLVVEKQGQVGGSSNYSAGML